MNDHKLQKVVYEQFRGYALKTVFRYIYNYDNAVDVVNDGFVKFFRTFNRFENGANELENHKKLMGYLKRIMVNTAIDALRKTRMSPESGPIPDDVWDIPDTSREADQAIIYKDLIILVKQLPPIYRTVFNMYVIDGYNHIEISEIMKMSVGNSKSTLSRARVMLKDGLKKLEENK